MLLEGEKDNNKEIEIKEKTSNEYDLKYRTNLFQIGFMTDDSFSETIEDNPKDVRPNNSAIAIVKLPIINIKCFDGEPKNWHTFIDSFEFAIKMILCLTFKY